MVIMASGNRKKRKDGKSREEALEEAIKECENLLKKPKNPRKLVEYEFHREPITGIRETTTPYRPTPPRASANMQGSERTVPFDGKFCFPYM